MQTEPKLALVPLIGTFVAMSLGIAAAVAVVVVALGALLNR